MLVLNSSFGVVSQDAYDTGVHGQMSMTESLVDGVVGIGIVVLGRTPASRHPSRSNELAELLVRRLVLTRAVGGA